MSIAQLHLQRRGASTSIQSQSLCLSDEVFAREDAEEAAAQRAEEEAAERHRREREAEMKRLEKMLEKMGGKDKLQSTGKDQTVEKELEPPQGLQVQPASTRKDFRNVTVWI
jgi:hypothetical protein